MSIHQNSIVINRVVQINWITIIDCRFNISKFWNASWDFLLDCDIQDGDKVFKCSGATFFITWFENENLVFVFLLFIFGHVNFENFYGTLSVYRVGTF